MDDNRSPATAFVSSAWREKRVIAISLLIALSQFQYGFDAAAVAGFQSMPGFLVIFGYVDPASPGGYNLHVSVHTLIQSLMQVGGFIASIFIFTFGTTISRRLGLWVASAFGLVAVSIQMGTTSLAGLYIGRLLLGVSNGFYITYSVTYMGEIAPAFIRGSIIGMVTFQTSLGALLGILVDNYTETNIHRLSYQTPLAVMLAVPAVIAVGLIFLYDSPRYYVSRGREDLAAASVRQLRGLTDEVRIQAEVAEFQAAWAAEIELHQQAHLKDVFRGTDLRRTMISIGASIGQTATGVIFMSSFSVYFFAQADIGQPFMWVMISLAIALTGNMAAFPAMRWVDRRILLVFGSLVSGATMLAMAIVYTVAQTGSSSSPKALVGLSIVFTWVYSISQGPLLWAVQTEVPSQRLRSQTVGLGQGCNFVFAWLCTYCTPYFVNPDALNWGPKYCYIWAGSNFILAVWAFFFVPETRRRTLEQIDDMFTSEVSTVRSSRFLPSDRRVNADNMMISERFKEPGVSQLEHMSEREPK